MYAFNSVTQVRVGGQLCDTALFVRRLQLTGQSHCPEKTRAEETETNFNYNLQIADRSTENGSG